MISFIVPAYNEASFLGATLQSIKAAAPSLENFEIVVTDNNSTDETADIAKEHGATVVFEPHNQIAKARNTGAAIAKGEIFIFVDADTLISKELIQDVQDALDNGAVGGGALISFDNPGGYVRRLVVKFWTKLSLGFGWAAGSFVYCRSEAFRAVGGFPEQFYASEELHFSKAIKQHIRGTGATFKILTDHPVVTSARKLEKGYRLKSFFQFVLITFCPFLVRTRRGCLAWYDSGASK